MEKLTDCVILYHKKIDYPLWDNEVWTPLEVGAALREPLYDFGLRDSVDPATEENISAWNAFFAETTGIFWNWKHLDDKKYAGNIQYRRRFNINTFEELENIFAEHNVIAAEPLNLVVSVKRQYALCHNATDMDILKKIVLRLFPDYKESWNKYIENGRRLYYSNGFIMKEEDYARYCEWLFAILFEFKRIMAWKSVEDLNKYVEGQIKAHLRPNRNGYNRPEGAVEYQRQIGGFLSERLWTLYLQHNFKPEEIKCLPYLKMEGNIL